MVIAMVKAGNGRIWWFVDNTSGRTFDVLDIS